jgi:leader peptidase (prepilin peptidase)/N-methyltransferase
MWNEFILFLSESQLSCGFVFCFGIVIGSFLNVVIHRLPMMIEYDNAEMINDNSIQPTDAVKEVLKNKVSLSIPASHCFNCKHKIPFYHNIPVLSYFILRGKCSNCKSKFSARYMLIELFTGISLSALFYLLGPTLPFLAYSFLLCLLIAGSFIDIDNLIIPDSITVLMVGSGLAYSLSELSMLPPKEAILGVVLPIIPFYGFYYVYSLIRGQGKFGFGDIKFIAAIGAWVGVQGALTSILIAPFLGIIAYVIMAILGKVDKTKPIPFIPFMSVGLILSIIYQQIYGTTFLY